MTGNVSFYGKSNETTGKAEQNSSSMAESTGSVGYKAFGYESVPDIDRTLAKDTVSFRGNVEYDDNDSSPITTVLGVAGMAALAGLGLGYAKKTGAINKIKDGKVKDIINKVAEPCCKMYCKVESLSKNCYDKVVNFFSKKK